LCCCCTTVGRGGGTVGRRGTDNTACCTIHRRRVGVKHFAVKRRKEGCSYGKIGSAVDSVRHKIGVIKDGGRGEFEI